MSPLLWRIFIFDNLAQCNRLKKNITVQALYKIKIEVSAFFLTWFSLIVISNITNVFYPLEEWSVWLLNIFFISFPILFFIFRRDLYSRFPFKEENKE